MGEGDMAAFINSDNFMEIWDQRRRDGIGVEQMVMGLINWVHGMSAVGKNVANCQGFRNLKNDRYINTAISQGFFFCFFVSGLERES